MRRCIFEEDDGLASVAGMEAGNSGRFCSSSLPAASSLVCRSPGPASAGPGRADRHFLDACFLCNKPLANETIFMYRGDTPFCSQECRLEQMNKDNAEEFKDWSLTPKVSGSREEAQKPPGKPRNYHAGTGAGPWPLLAST